MAWLARNRLRDAAWATLFRGAVAVVAVLFASSAFTILGGVLSVRSDMTPTPGLQRLLNALNLIAPAVLIVVVSWLATQHVRRIVASVAVLAIGLALLIVAWPFAMQGWSYRAYSGANAERFADWRAAIPPGAEVFWFDGLRETWFVLHRKSYLSISQGAGVLFSGKLADELRRRALSASAFIEPGVWFGEPGTENSNPYPLTHARLADTCRDPALGFVVSHDDLKTGAPSKEWPWQGSRIFLYDCRHFRPRNP
jgi:hypothetical protein